MAKKKMKMYRIGKQKGLPSIGDGTMSDFCLFMSISQFAEEWGCNSYHTSGCNSKIGLDGKRIG